MKQIERRFLRGSETRAKKGETAGIEGVASVYNQEYDTGWFRERILPGAFTRVLGEDPDVRCLFNHDPNQVLGRTKSGTLRLVDEKAGLSYECDTDSDTQVGRDVPAMVDRGDVDGCSFSFTVAKQAWREVKDDSGNVVVYRDIEEIDELFDVGPVTFPAYTGTAVSARSFWPTGVPEEVRSRIPSLSESESKTGRADASSRSELQPARSTGVRELDLAFVQMTSDWPACRARDVVKIDADTVSVTFVRSKSDDGQDCECNCDECQDGRCGDCSCEDGCDAEHCGSSECCCAGNMRMRMRLRLAEATL